MQNTRNPKKLIVSHAGGSKSNARRASQMVSYFRKFLYYTEVKYVIHDNCLLIYILLMMLGATIGKACMSK